jgi:hypothetical protein
MREMYKLQPLACAPGYSLLPLRGPKKTEFCDTNYLVSVALGIAWSWTSTSTWSWT